MTEPLTVKATAVGMVRSAATVRVCGGANDVPPYLDEVERLATGDGEGAGEDDGGGGRVDRAAGLGPVAVGADGPGQGEGGPDRFGDGQVGEESGTGGGATGQSLRTEPVDSQKPGPPVERRGLD